LENVLFGQMMSMRIAHGNNDVILSSNSSSSFRREVATTLWESRYNRFDHANFQVHALLNKQQQQQQRVQTRDELIIKRHLFGVPPPNDPKIFEDAAG
jgi:hypothetical protein